MAVCCQKIPGIAVKQLPLAGQIHFSEIIVEQIQAEFLFQLLNCYAERGLRYIQGLCRSRIALLLRYLHKINDLPYVQYFIPGSLIPLELGARPRLQIRLLLIMLLLCRCCSHQ